MKLATLGLILLMAYSCKTKQIENIKEAEMPYLTFTSGGGFAGTYTTYVLLENGQIFKQKQNVETAKAVGNIDKDQASQIFANYQFLNMDEVDQVSYGNYTYSIVKTENGADHKIMWEKDQAGAEVYQIFYKNAMAVISQSRESFKPDTPSKKR